MNARSLAGGALDEHSGVLVHPQVWNGGLSIGGDGVGTSKAGFAERAAAC